MTIFGRVYEEIGGKKWSFSGNECVQRCKLRYFRQGFMEIWPKLGVRNGF